MIIVIDAYNVLKQVENGSDIAEHKRQRFIDQLHAYAKQKGHKVVVVFDGGPHEWPHKQGIHKVRVVYSGVNDTADDYIIGYLNEHKAEDLLLVSNDRELNHVAQQHNIVSIDSLLFYSLLCDAVYDSFNEIPALAPDDGATKLHDQEQDVDELMRQASEVVPIKSEDVAYERRVSKARTESKTNKRLLQKIKKL